VWYKGDRTFGLPKACLFLRLRTPVVYQSPTSIVLANLYTQMLQDALNEFAYASQIAGLSYKSVTCTHTQRTAVCLRCVLYALPTFLSSRSLADVFVSIVLSPA